MESMLQRSRFILVVFALVCEIVVVVMALLVHHPSTIERVLAEFDSMLFGFTLGLVSIMHFTRRVGR